MDILKEKIDNYYENIFCTPGEDHDTYKHRFTALMDDFDKDTFIITDRFELSYLQEKITRMRRQIPMSFGLSKDEKERAIGILDTYRQKIKFSDRRIDQIQKEIMHII
jgi:hypothetical protein